MLIGGRQTGGAERVERRVHPFGRPVADPFEDLPLGREVVIVAGLVDAGRFADLLDGRAESLAPEHLSRDLEEFLVPG